MSRLTATNGAAYSMIQFSGGTISTKSTAVANGDALMVGDGTMSATLNLLGGTHQFADGLIVTYNDRDYAFAVNYSGGDGNDLVLTTLAKGTFITVQ